MKKRHHQFIILLRVFLGLVFFTAGMSKLYDTHQFPGLIGPVWLEERLAEHGLALYARFIAWSQVIAGLLLFTQRFATLGAVLTFPIILNIFVVTVSLEWQGTPYVNFALLLLNLWLLLYDYHKFKFIFSNESERLVHFPLQRKNKSADVIWGLAALGILISIPLSYLNLLAAWVLCVVMIMIIIWNQWRNRMT